MQSTEPVYNTYPSNFAGHISVLLLQLNNYYSKLLLLRLYCLMSMYTFTKICWVDKLHYLLIKTQFV